MKRIFSLIIASALASLLFFACEKGPEPIPIESLETYQDPITNFELKYPSNWKTTEQTERFVVFSDPQVSKRFRDYATIGFPGAKVDMIAMRMDSTMTLDSVVKRSMLFEESIYQKENITFGGEKGYKLTYAFDLDGGPFMGEIYIAAKDTGRATVLIFETFDGTMDTYKPQFDEIVKSVKLAETPKARAEADTLFEQVEAAPPSDTLTTKSGEGFKIDIPKNFYTKSGEKAQSALKTYFYWGDRRGDSFIRVDIFDATEQKDLNKIVEENKAAYGNGTAQNATLGGQAAKKIDYKASGAVKGRVFFAVKGTKLYRVTINWFTGEEKDFLPPFEKSVQSFEFQ